MTKLKSVMALALAASFLIGIVAGYFVLPRMPGEPSVYTPGMVLGPETGVQHDPARDASGLPDDGLLGRPIIKGGTVMTANGTLMRGMVFGAYEMLMSDGMGFTFEDVALIRENGMNCVRFTVPIIWPYGENTMENQIYLEAADLFIDWAQELGLYVWLGPSLLIDEDGNVFFDHIMEYWQIIAPRYKNRTHVFYDIVNEMGEPDATHPQSGNSPSYMARAYDLIRELAPDTLCVLWSFSHTFDLDETLWCIIETEKLVSNEITWTNEAVGFHAYEAANGYYEGDAWINYDLMRFVIGWFRENGYPIMNTEVPPLAVGYDGSLELSSYPNPELIRILEDEGVSWTTLLHLAHLNEPSVWRGLIHRHDLSWLPDYGAWPATGLINPYKPQPAITTPFETNAAQRSMSEAGSIDELGNIPQNRIPSLFVNNSHYITYGSLNFGPLEPISLTVRVRGFEDGARIIVREGGRDGSVICEIPISQADMENVYYTGYLLRPVSGVSDITFTFSGPEEGMDYFAICYFIDWQFNLPPVDSMYLHTDIWNVTVPAARFHYRNGGSIWRAPSDDADAVTGMGRTLKVVGITDGSQILYSMAAFTAGGDAVFTIRAKPIYGGRIEVYAGWGFRIWPDPWWTFQLGHCQISGAFGQWAEFELRIPAQALNMINYSGSYSPHAVDLMFKFVADDETPEGVELFEISEFRFVR